MMMVSCVLSSAAAWQDVASGMHAHLDGVCLALLQICLHLVKLTSNHYNELCQEGIHIHSEVVGSSAVMLLKVIDTDSQNVKLTV